MLPIIFEELLTWIPPYIQKQETKMREPISPRERLCVALRYLVTGDAQVTKAANYRMRPAITGRIVNETCKAIWDELINKGYLDYPSSEHDWLKVAQEFEDLSFLITRKHTTLFLWLYVKLDISSPL